MKEGQASTTAMRVARQRLGFVRVAHDGGRPEDDEKLQTDVAGSLDTAPSVMSRYLAARTGFFDRRVVEAIGSGIEQVVVAGAGYDGRSLRYASPGVAWFELDHPSTQADKRARLERLGIPTGETAFGAADFGDADIAALLKSLGHDRTRPTLFFCEGVAPYLPAAVLRSLLGALGRSAAPGSRLAIEIALVPSTTEQEERRTQLAAAVASMGEPLLTFVERQDLATLFEAAGWRIGNARDPAGRELESSETSVAFVVAVPEAPPPVPEPPMTD